jgi:sec-independent protein translocase protein TatA
MFGLGVGELLVILVIVLVLFSRRLPDLGEGLGKSVRKFRKAMNASDEIDVTPKKDASKP